MHNFLTKIPVSVIMVLSVLTVTGQIAYIAYIQYFARYDVIIASSPANVQIFLDSKRIGETPLTVPLKQGTYTIEAKKKGYENTVHAISVKSKESNVVNIQLLPTRITENASGGNKAKVDGMETIRNDLEKLKLMIISNPEDAATIPIMVERLRFQNEEIKALRESIKSINDLSKYYLGSIVAILLGLLAVIASLFIAIKK